MVEFSKQISEKWNVPVALSEQLCNAFNKGDTPYYLVEYHPETAIELSISTLWEIFDFLKNMEELSSKKKRILNALKKAGTVSPNVEKHVNLTSSSFELDDMLLPLRPNPRSKGQVASKKGLDPLADKIMQQKEEITPVEVLAEEYIGKDSSLTSVEDVIQGVKEIIAERISYDDTVRAMVREFAYEDGFFDITPKNKKDPEYTSYIGKNVAFNELSKEQILKFLHDEEEKNVRLKVGVQLFRITEVMRHHVITNPESVGFDLLCGTIDDTWIRLLQPAIERDIKVKLLQEAEEWAIKRLLIDLEKTYKNELQRGALLIADAKNEKNLQLIAISGQGNFLGATSEKKPPEGKVYASDRLKQFLSRHKPQKIVIIDNDQAKIAEGVLKAAIAGSEPAPEIEIIAQEKNSANPSDSEWMKNEFATLLDDEMREMYGAALKIIKPVSLQSRIGTKYYSIHPFQNLISPERLTEIVKRIMTMAELQKGILIKDVLESPLSNLTIIKPEVINAIRAADAKGEILSKNDLLKAEGMSELIFRNISGFIIIPNAEDILDRSMVHPDHYPWFTEMSEQFNVSIDTIVSDPDALNSFETDDPIKKIYIQKKVIAFVTVALNYSGVASPKTKRKLKLTELKEGAIVSGRVTNITPFGVFININAVCDGLIHISQLADEYVETPEQVVHINDKVDVRILKVDVKKRRISLSMKNLGNMAPKVRPSKGQLDNLAEHFKNR
jgi:uncharacterized protein